MIELPVAVFKSFQPIFLLCKGGLNHAQSVVQALVSERRRHNLVFRADICLFMTVSRAYQVLWGLNIPLLRRFYCLNTFQLDHISQSLSCRCCFQGIPAAVFLFKWVKNRASSVVQALVSEQMRHHLVFRADICLVRTVSREHQML